MKKMFKIIPLMLLPLLLSSCSLDDIIPFFSSSDDPVVPVISYSEPEDGSSKHVQSKYTYKSMVKNHVYNLDYCPSIGNPKLLVIPVWFTDSANYISTSNREDVRSDIEKAYFGSTSDTGWHSVKTYYERDSFGNLHLEGTVSSWYECGKSSSYFYQDYSEDSVTNQLVLDAVSWYRANNGNASLTEYDTDKNGYLDGVLLIYGAPDYDSMEKDNADNLWAYCYWIQDTSLKRTSYPGANTFFWASYDFMYSSGIKAKSRTGKSTYGGGDTRYCNIDTHTYIHEMGHVLGLDDYYDYSESNATNPAGNFSMQDYNIGAHDPFSRIALGWVAPIVPQKSTTITINPMENSGDVVLLCPDYTGSPFDEYILIELFTATGLNEFDCKYAYRNSYPKGPTTPGARVWHVDARLYTWTSNTKGYVTNDASKSNIEQATSNTASGAHACKLAGSYDYKLNFMIRNSTTETYKATSDLSASTMFRTGSSFSMSKYSKQFVNTGKLDSNNNLGWSVNFDQVSSTGMTITCTKA